MSKSAQAIITLLASVSLVVGITGCRDGQPSRGPTSVAPVTASPPGNRSTESGAPTQSPATGNHPNGTAADRETAAWKFGWGAPLPGSDEFNYTGRPDPSKWLVYGEGGDAGGASSNCWPGHDNNGRRCAYAATVRDGYLRETGYPNGDSAGMASRTSLMYGRWEVRARLVAAPGATGNLYNAVLIAWPTSNLWPEGGEYDFLENTIGDACAKANLHYPVPLPVRREKAHRCGVDLTQWHNYALEWTPKGLKGYIDGVPWFDFHKDCIQCAPGPMNQTIQLDNFFGSGGMQRAYLDVDWARVYSVGSPRPGVATARAVG